MPYRSIFFLFFSFFFVILKGQEVRVSDNKGTLQTVTSNRVTTSAAAPTTPVEGDVWFDTSTNLSKIYDGAIWKTIDEDKVSTSAAAPTTPVEGDVWFDTTNNISKIYDGSVWKAIQSTAKSIWDDDNDTGIQIEESADEDKIRFDTGGSERMIIDETGDVGIGTTTPNSQLHVSGGPVKIETTGGNSASTYATRQAVLTFNRDDIPTSWTNKITTSFSGTASEHTLNFELATGQNTDTTVMTLNALGNVGIGTTAPTQRLDVNGSARVRTLDAGIVGTDEIVVADANGVLKKVAASNLNNDWKILGNSGTTAGSNFVGTTDSQDLVFKTNNVEAARFKSAEQRLVFANTGDFVTPGVSTSAVLGIDGTTHGRLRLTAGSQETYNDSEGASIDLHGNTSTANTGVLDLVAGQAASGTDAAIKLWTNSIGAAGGQATRMVVTGNGDVGIGTTAPAKQLHVEGDARITDVADGATTDSILVRNTAGDVLKVSSTALVSEPWFGTDDDAAATLNTEDMYVMSSRVGIGTNNPTAPLDLAVTSETAIEFDNGDNIITVHDGSGNFNFKSGVDDDNKITSTAGGTHFRLDENGLAQLSIDEGTAIGGNFSSGLSFLMDNDVFNFSGGNVGVNVTDPDGRLTVQDEIINTLVIKTSDNTKDVGLAFQNSGGNYTSSIYRAENNTANEADLVFAAGAGTLTLTSLSERMRITQAGNVGIGTTAPTQRLDVDGQARIRTLNAGAAADELVVADANGVLKKRSLTDVVQEPWHTEGTTTEHTANTGNMFFMGDIAVGQNTTTAGKVATFAGDVDIQGVLDPTKIIMSGDGTVGSFNPTTDGQYEIEFQEGRDLEIKSNTTDNIVHMENAGDVGIGTGNPDAKLEVSTAGETKVRITAGAENQDAILEFNNSIGQDPTAANYAVKNAIVSDGLGTWKRADMRFVLNNEANNNEYSIANDTRMIIKPSGNVGINTTNPTNLLHINTTSTATDNWLLKLESNPSTAGRKNVGMLFTADDGGGGAYNMAKISAGFLGSNSWNDARLYLGAGNGTPTRMTIRGNGNVGIGTTTPIYNMDVNGTFKNNNAGLFSVMGGNDDDVPNTTAGGHPKRGIFMWDDSDPNWGIYMSRPGAGRALDGGTAVAGSGFNSHAIRFRVNNNTSQGFIFENAADQNLFSIRASDGFAYFRNNVRIDGLPTNTGTNSDDIVVADATGVLKKVSNLAATKSTVSTIIGISATDVQAALQELKTLQEKSRIEAILQSTTLVTQNAGSIPSADRGSETTASVFPSTTANQVYFSNGNYYSPFYMPDASTWNSTNRGGKFLFIRSVASYQVTIKKARTDLTSDITTSSGKYCVFKDVGSTWEYIGNVDI